MSRIVSFLTVALSCATLWAQQAPQPSHPDPLAKALQGTVLRDDDDGKVQALPIHELAYGRLIFHNGPVVHTPWVHMIFLGMWRDPAQLAVKDQAVNYFNSFVRSDSFISLSKYGVHIENLPSTFTEILPDSASQKRISDLEIQHLIKQAQQKPPAGTSHSRFIYVVFLSSGMTSTVGKSIGGNDYVAYHNHFNADNGDVRYVVVPFDDDSNRWLLHAGQSVIQAMLNPEGTGWYAESAQRTTGKKHP